MKRHIPNFITCLNVTCGAIAIVMAAKFNNLNAAALFIVAGMVFDFFDGLTARALNVKSEVGKELDSLADVCSFGVAPAILAYSLMLQVAPVGMEWLAWIAFIMPALSAYRLAKFNLDTRQTVSFIGMPTPANALFWVGLVFGMGWAPEIYNAIFANIYVLAIFVVGLSLLLISELPMFSLKLQGLGWSENKALYIFLLLALISLPIIKSGTIMILMPLYIIVCFIHFITRK